MYLSRQNGKWVLALALCVATACLGTSVSAHESGKGQHREKWPQAQLQAEASAEIAQDTVKITLASEISDASQTAVASALSKTLEDVMNQAKGHAKIKVSSGNYRIWPMSDKDGKISNWRGRGEIFLESSDFAAASELASTLSDRMPIANLGFSVSRSEEHTSELQSLMRISYAVFCLKKKNNQHTLYQAPR